MGRQQYVEYNGYKSQPFHVNSGVAQSSNLGPVLFVIFLNDVINHLRCKVYIYADDLKLVCTIRTYEDCLILQDNIDKFIE